MRPPYLVVRKSRVGDFLVSVKTAKAVELTIRA
jgi:hypothetical protein